MVVFFTDAHRMGIAVDGTLIRPDDTKRVFEPGKDRFERMGAFNYYLQDHVWPWFDDFVKPYRVIDRTNYRRGMMTHWAAVLELEPPRPTRRPMVHHTVRRPSRRPGGGRHTR
jgi:hypothetical protein